MSRNVELKLNEGFLDAEQALVRMFTEESSRHQMMAQLVRWIDNNGCEGHLGSPEKQKKRHSRVNVLAVDVAWFVPGIDWIGSKGCQACWSVASEPNGTSWYRVVLNEYFSKSDAVSLLGLRDVFRRPLFVNLAWIGSGRTRKRPTFKPAATHDVWTGIFDPRRSSNPSVKQWDKHFTRYLKIIGRQLTAFHPEIDQRSTMLAWVYLGPGRAESDTRDSPPHWGASIFLVFHSPTSKPGSRDVPGHVNTLLANLLRTLQNSAPAALGNRREKQTLVQVVAHEFKNISQEAAILAQEVKSRVVGLRQLPQEHNQIHVAVSEIETLMRKAQAMNYCVQLCSAFALAANWLFSSKPPEAVVEPDRDATHFRHALALTLRLVAVTVPNWNLENVPTEQDILGHFKRNGVKAARVEDLSGNFSISIMIFFALEAVRNMRKSTPENSSVKVCIDGEGPVAFLTLVTDGELPAKGEVSFSVTALVEEVGLHCPWPLIEIDPVVRLESAGPGRVRRSTKFSVHNILPLQHETRNQRL